MKYFVLGTKAESFSDAQTGLVVTKRTVGKLEGESNRHIQSAIGNGHLKEVNESEADALIKDKGFQFYGENPEFKKNMAQKVKDGIVSDPAKIAKAAEDAAGDTDGDGDVDAEDLTKAELLEAIQNDTDVPDDEKKGLSSKNKDELIKIYKKYVA